ncbi:GlxA family transcriptional regulator [Kribbella sp. NBC_00359]|uniref:GlxA family transcriptional regulator n=1 Tax=Kribbella sp. NBC_00359 TaxID=2975966 RepID=UPI002E1B0792
MTHVIALALSDGVPIFELAAPAAIFGTNRSELTTTDWYDLRVCGPANARVDAWFTTTTPYRYEDLIAADTVIVPACHDEALNPPSDLVDAVRSAAERGARIVSICTGAFVLAAAGLLDGRRATTHWLHAATLARRYPHIEVDPAALYVDEGRVLTSAGKSAGMDLCLHIVRCDYGADVANQVARRLVTPPHREGDQSQYIDPTQPRATHDTLGNVMDWAIRHLGEPITVEQLARQGRVSVRTLHRHFNSHAGTNPLDWLNSQRVRRAQQLLETTGLPIEHIASHCGFGTATAFRRQFRRILDTTPDNYRRTFTTEVVTPTLGDMQPPS